jgi:hypothetical protein
MNKLFRKIRAAIAEMEHGQRVLLDPRIGTDPNRRRQTTRQA